jgi:hypothetical protein
MAEIRMVHNLAARNVLRLGDRLDVRAAHGRLGTRLRKLEGRICMSEARDGEGRTELTADQFIADTREQAETLAELVVEKLRTVKPEERGPFFTAWCAESDRIFAQDVGVEIKDWAHFRSVWIETIVSALRRRLQPMDSALAFEEYVTDAMVAELRKKLSADE